MALYPSDGLESAFLAINTPYPNELHYLTRNLPSLNRPRALRMWFRRLLKCRSIGFNNSEFGWGFESQLYPE